MAHKRVGQTREESYEEWLGRIEEELGTEGMITALQEELMDQLGIATPAQLEALREAMGRHTTLTEAGIHQVVIEYPWGRETRYGIQGMPGLWGWERVREILYAEEWWE